jgi:putative inorganic carbon (hco3(-)) transporter
MPLKTVLFLLAFAACCGAAPFAPVWGVLGYVIHYCLGPETAWWAVSIQSWGIRYSLVLAIATAIGVATHWGHLRFGGSLTCRHERLILLMLGLVWLSTFVGEPTTAYTLIDHPAVKMTKVVIFLLMLTHVVTTARHLNLLMWALIAGSMMLGFQAYTTPLSHFAKGRIEGIGGTDFNEANFLGAFLGAMLPLIGVQFLRSGWIGRLVCLVSGVFATNAVVLTRSRGAVVGIGCGILVAVFLAPRKHRAMLLLGLAVAVLGAYRLMDPAFLGRVSTVSAAEEERDRSAQSRIEIWKASGQMLEDHPFGVGAGNFFQTIGRYFSIPGADAHSTFVRAACELGLQGIAVLLVVVASAFRMLWCLPNKMEGLPATERDRFTFLVYGLTISLTVILAAGMTISLLYMEALWWLLVMPVCLERVLENLKEDLAADDVGPEADGYAD